MCGLAGIFSPLASFQKLETSAKIMAGSISHRGNDDSGTWVDPDGCLAFSHQRLAIADLTPAGHQPMLSSSGRYVIVFNGEIYNHLEIRRILSSLSLTFDGWLGQSDTETLLAAIEVWGLEETLKRCIGMFALVLWDRRERVLQFARDRLGEKPLYLGLCGSEYDRALIFGSELSALKAWPGFNNPIDRQSLSQLLRFGAIAAPRSIHVGIQQLLPGHFLSLPLLDGLPVQLPPSEPWWCLRSRIASNADQIFSNQNEALEALEEALDDAVQLQSLADVPLGSFLSGGIDSSLITALLQAASSRPVRTFTVAFEESDFNEAPYARAIAAYLGTYHHEMLLSAADAQALIPLLPRLYCEPFADSSQLPTHMVCREARRSGLTVAIGGDGGDELFGGYNRYFWGPRIWNRLSWLPWPLRRLLAQAIHLLPPAGWDALGRPFPIEQLGHKAHKLADRLAHVKTTDDLYRSLVSEWRDPAAVMQPSNGEVSVLEPGSLLDLPLPDGLVGNSVARMMAYDTLNYLPNDILTKVDRAAMAATLETRAPFLDHRVVELAWRLPMAMKIRGSTSKWALRQILFKHVPRELIERPKAGFGMPIGHWLRGPLRSWANDLLDPVLMQSQGYLRPEPIQRLWRQHLSGRFDHTTRLWTVLMWQAWLEEWG